MIARYERFVFAKVATIKPLVSSATGPDHYCNVMRIGSLLLLICLR